MKLHTAGAQWVVSVITAGSIDPDKTHGSKRECQRACCNDTATERKIMALWLAEKRSQNRCAWRQGCWMRRAAGPAKISPAAQRALPATTCSATCRPWQRINCSHIASTACVARYQGRSCPHCASQAPSASETALQRLWVPVRFHASSIMAYNKLECCNRTLWVRQTSPRRRPLRLPRLRVAPARASGQRFRPAHRTPS